MIVGPGEDGGALMRHEIAPGTLLDRRHEIFGTLN